MNDDNDKTLESYEGHVQDYVAANKPVTEGDLKAWIDRALSFAAKGATILELGSAYGRDATYIESLGYKVIRTDAVQGFVNLLRAGGHEARKLNVLTDDFGKGYDMVFANAVLLHFSPEQFRQVLIKARNCLKPGGVLAFSVKKGNGDEWSSHNLGAPRYFHFWQQEALQSIVQDTGFKVEEISERKSNFEWLQVIARK
jgi:SAM-dependent methyltransferase